MRNARRTCLEKNDLPKVKDAMSRSVFFLREDDFATKGRALFRNFEYRSQK